MGRDTTVRRVVVAPDKFKGSLSADQVADLVIDAVHVVSPGATLVRHPIADGGEGTVGVALAAGFAPVHVEVGGPLGTRTGATYAVRGEVAVLELSAAAGLAQLLVPPNVRTALESSTHGVGELIDAALDHGARRIVLGVGGSASTDGGAGLVRALGVRVLDVHGTEIAGGGAGLAAAAMLDPSGLDPRVRRADLVVAADVDNPLTGPTGAAAVYAPQKGADADAVHRLDEALAHWADLVAATSGADHRHVAGAGAAGGTAFAALALLGARLARGVDVLAELTGLDAELADADLVIVGEGSLDTQSLRGKGPVGIAARAHGVPVIAIAGRNLLTEDQWQSAGLSAVYALTDLEPRLDVCIREAGPLLSTLAERVAREWIYVQ
ncbi:glycerate kinase [uncultured Jatrophihabitans sp.]|uniref:glycerate kinase n=1 Tax=uncultured Jatrophihabitans sp. TaxID=1610747 RepID=UPI0035CC5F05